MRSSPRSVGLFVYPGFDLLDLSGPLEALQWAEKMAPGSYTLRVTSLTGGAVECSSQVTLSTVAVDSDPLDTLIVVGGSVDAVGFRDPTQGFNDPAVVAYVRTASKMARRVASVCTGAFLLAAAGVLDGRRATTHWLYAQQLQSRHPKVHVDGDRIFVQDDEVWTSAGITAGIDMALALIEADLGRDLSRAVARMLVVYHRRAGGQLQFSSLLDLEPDSDRIRQVLSFMREHLAEPLPVERLAEVACLSVRQFGRAFGSATGLSPARAVERLRVEAARPPIEDGRTPFDLIARSVGFVDTERMRQAFVRVLGTPPQQVRRASRAPHALP